MSLSLRQIAEQLQSSNKKVQLIYAFNGTGKTRLSREFKKLIAPNGYGSEGEENSEQPERTRNKIIYYNAFTEDLFYWKNDLNGDSEPTLKIQPNTFTDWILIEQGQDRNIASKFQYYTNTRLEPNFTSDFSEVSFSLERGNNEHLRNIKISKGEESNFIWSVFYILLEQIIDTLNTTEEDDNEYSRLEYVFIDDPVSSMDENHLIQIAVDLAGLIKSCLSRKLKFIITTHNTIFYNVLHEELSLNSKDKCYLLEKLGDGTFLLNEKPGSDNQSFSYHLHLKKTIEQAAQKNILEKFHFTLLRNLYEKTASFLGYRKWKDLLPNDGKEAYYYRIIQFSSHSSLSRTIISEPTPQEKQTVVYLLNHLIENHNFWKKEE